MSNATARPGFDGCDKLVQDYERCLRCDEPLEELRKLSVEVISDYPKCSQDLNAIENAWNVLRERLDATLPTAMESREAVSRAPPCSCHLDQYAPRGAALQVLHEPERARNGSLPQAGWPHELLRAARRPRAARGAACSASAEQKAPLRTACSALRPSQRPRHGVCVCRVSRPVLRRKKWGVPCVLHFIQKKNLFF